MLNVYLAGFQFCLSLAMLSSTIFEGPQASVLAKGGSNVEATTSVPVHLHLWQPQQQNYDPPARPMILGYVSFPLMDAG